MLFLAAAGNTTKLAMGSPLTWLTGVAKVVVMSALLVAVALGETLGVVAGLLGGALVVLGMTNVCPTFNTASVRRRLAAAKADKLTP